MLGGWKIGSWTAFPWPLVGCLRVVNPTQDVAERLTACLPGVSFFTQQASALRLSKVINSLAVVCNLVLSFQLIRVSLG